MKVHVANHPLIAHKLTVLRDERTDSPTFRRLVEELVTLLAYEATREIRTHTVEITTPVTKTKGLKMARASPSSSSNFACRPWNARRHEQVNAKC